MPPKNTPQKGNPSSSRTVLDALADCAWIADLEEGRFLEINATLRKELGYRRQELEKKTVCSLYYDISDRSHGNSFRQEAWAKGSSLSTITFKTSAGEPLEMEMRGSPILHGGVKAVLVIARYIGAQLKERRRDLVLYEAFKRSNDVMFYCDRNGVILDVNEAFTQHYGFTREEAVGKRPNILRSRHSTPELYKSMWASIMDPAKGTWRGQMINKTKDGREIPLILNITAVKDPAGHIIGYVSNAIDMTEHVALQTRLAQSEALASLGEMAAVIAHEIRNPLGSIVMAANQLLAQDLSGEDRSLVLQVLRNESQRLNEALTNFLSYARPRELHLQRSSLNALLEDVLRIARANPELMGRTRMRVRLDKALKPFPMDPDQVRQILWNILLNALQALRGQGRLDLETGHARGHAFFRVQDDGPGIAPAAFPSLFKPFHTTKQQGTGLGLAIAHRIVQAHGGRIEVQSRPGEGAAFTVHLPALQDD